ncbi:hypothetical protein LCGC14_0224760 [marine sediment metagenome]|uniref:Uncharacterized protein n=1 Tax=marine sediment metagenome TaxID=412755 RepID=A0A0F9UTU3_9ZZZZ|nr:hypothetical protein [bacterium]
MSEIHKYLNNMESYLLNEDLLFKKALIRALDNIDSSIKALNTNIVYLGWDIKNVMKESIETIRPEFRGFK